MSSQKIKGTVKWFSNRKGFGFITPAEGSSITDDIFVHQSVISSEGYRTLFEGWVVEFDIGHDNDGKIKAENVTAPGGGPCTGPRPYRPRQTDRPPENAAPQPIPEARKEPVERTAERTEGTTRTDGRGRVQRRTRIAGGDRARERVYWHDSLSDAVKTAVKSKSIRTSSGTIDVAVGSARIKLGSRGYCSMARADAVLAEGTFTADGEGLVTFQWTRAIQFSESWKPLEDKSGFLTTLSLLDDAVGPVHFDETAATLMGTTPTDPAAALEANGFQMRHIVLTARRGR